MKNLTRNVLIIGTMACLSTSAFARDRHDRDGRFDGIRDRYRQGMNICSEIKEDFEEAERRYDRFDDNIAEYDRRYETVTSTIRQRESALSQAQTRVTQSSQRLSELEDKRRRAPQMIKQLTAKKSDVQNNQLPAAIVDKNNKEQEERRKCKTVLDELKPSCWKAKEKRDEARKRVSSLEQEIKNIDSELQDLSRIDQVISNTERNLRQAEGELDRERHQSPSIESLREEQRQVNEERNRASRGLEEVEDRMVRAEIRLEKCEEMSRDAQVYRSLKEHAQIFKTSGCENSDVIISNERNPLRRQGIQEAADIVCRSNDGRAHDRDNRDNRDNFGDRRRN